MTMDFTKTSRMAVQSSFKSDSSRLSQEKISPTWLSHRRQSNLPRNFSKTVKKTSTNSSLISLTTITSSHSVWSPPMLWTRMSQKKTSLHILLKEPRNRTRSSMPARWKTPLTRTNCGKSRTSFNKWCTLMTLAACKQSLRTYSKERLNLKLSLSKPIWFSSCFWRIPLHRRKMSS